MHQLFRVLGQQMGMQQVRAILPISIDAFINGAIIQKVRTLVLENLNVDLESRMIVHRNEIIPINALRTLYTEVSIPFEGSEETQTEGISEITIDSSISNNLMLYLGVSVKLDDDVLFHNCRIIDSIELEDTIFDFCNRPTRNNPISNIYGNKITIYTGNYIPSRFDTKVKYIKYPAKVHLDENQSSNNVNCDLPEYLHEEIVELAVRTYFTSLGYTSPNREDKT